MTIQTKNFYAYGLPTGIVANKGVVYTNVQDGKQYVQLTVPYGSNWVANGLFNFFYYPTSGAVSSVTGSAPIQSSGGTNPNISIPKADASTDGYLSSADWNTFNAGSSITPSALTKTNDTNVTLTLGGTPNTSLLQAVSLTLGWSGTLADSRISSASVWNAKQNALAGSGLVKSTGGTISYVSGTSSQFVKGDGSLDSNSYLTSAVTSVGATTPITSSGGATPTISTSMNTNKLIGRSTAGTGVMEEITVGSGLTLSGTTLSASGVTGAALTKTDDTNVTLALTGTPTTALLQAVNVAVGWSGTLADSRISSASVWNAKQNALAGSGLVKSAAGTISYVSGTASQFVKGDGSLDSNSYLTSAVTSVGATSPITSSGGTTPTISSSMATNKLIGRSTVGTGVMEEISVGTGLLLSGGTLSNTLPFTTPLTTKGDIYTRNASVDTRLPVGLDTQMLVADSSTTTGLKWAAQPAATPTGYYAMYQDVLTQNIAVINTGYPIKFRTLDLSNGVTVVSDSRITFANTGIYNLQFSVQLENSDTQEHDATIWLRLNGTDVPGSAGFVAIVAKHGGINGHILPSWNYLLNVVAGQYYELVWSATSTQVTMPFIAAGTPPPSTASAIFTVTQQAGIMAGTGITAINSLTGAAQTLVAGTSGTDFAVSSAGTAHTLDLPTASATNRGALSSTDWSTFNNKQAALGFTPVTNARTISTTAPLSGGGDLTANRTLSIPAATTSADGYLSSTDWNTFNGRQISPWAYRLSGRWYTPSNNALAIGSLGNLANSIRYSPVIIDRDITITQLGIAVVTIAGAGNTARVGIYSNNASTNQPLTRLVDSGTLAVDSTGTKTATGLSVSLTKGLYWFAYFSNASTGTVASIANLNLPDVIGVGASLQLGIITGYTQSLAYTTLPATASGLGNILSGASSYCVYYYY